MAVAAPIVEQIKDLRLKLKVAKTSDDTAQQLREYRSFESSLVDTRRVFNQAFEEYEVLVDFEGAVKKSDYSSIFNEFTQRFDDIIDNADKGKSADNRTIFALTSLNNRFKEAVSANWQSYLKKRIESVYNTFLMFKDFVADFDAVNRAKNDVFSSRPTTPNIADKIDKLISACILRINQAGGSDEDIKAFIKKVGDGHATVDDLTPKILEWLKDKKFSSKIKIQM